MVDTLESTGDFVLLDDNSAYKKYFGMLARAFDVLIAWYKQTEGAGDEEVIIAHYLRRMTNTLKLLALKCSYASHPTMRLDLNDSGYPHAIAIKAMDVDLLHRDETLQSLDTQVVIKDDILTHLTKSDEEPAVLLETMSLRQYFDLLNPCDMILPFTPGELIFKGEDDERRQYLYSWVHYDPDKSIPNIYILAFEQDVTEEPLHVSDANREEFLIAVRQSGSGAKRLQSIATSIDEAVEAIHPKCLKRIKLGPILSLEYSRNDHPLLEYLRHFGKELDFIFHIRSEMVFSKRQVEQKGRGFFSASRIREVFSVSLDDLDCAEAGVSRIRRMMLLPHHLSQHLNRKDEAVTKYDAILTYTNGGEVHAI